MKQKVCLVTGAAGQIGQRVLLNLVSKGKKVLALGEVDDIFSPNVLKNNHVKINTALPVTDKSFNKHDIQFCFGDLSDISFLASIFSSADSNNIEIEYVIHLSANSEIQKTSPHAYHPDFGDTINLLEVARAYWQAHPKSFKKFFFASDSSNKVNDKIIKMMEKISKNDGFPTKIYNEDVATPIGSNYNGSTPLSALYRLITPVKAFPTRTQNTQLSAKKSSKQYITSLIGAISHTIDEN